MLIKQKIVKFYKESDNVLNESYFWNAVSGMINAGQSVVLLMIIGRVRGIEDAGIFSIAYAIASLMLTIGNFGMRNYQATDSKEKYIYSEYLVSRIWTVIIMLIVSIFYIIKGRVFDGYSYYKMLIILLVCILKILDAAEDIFEGRCQQKGRLDIAAKCLAIRCIFTILSLCLTLLLFKNFLLALCIAVIISVLFIVFYYNDIFCELGKVNFKAGKKRVSHLLYECFPLFAGSYLALYIGNAPKYAIDSVMSSSDQACFNYVFMPVFVIGLLNNFIYQPILSKLAIEWNSKKYRKFIHMVVRQLLVIVGLTILVLIFGYLMGIPVLSVLYDNDLNDYKQELMVLLLGGGMLAFSGFFNVVLTIMREQKKMLLGYFSVAAIAMLISRTIVKNFGTLGAAYLYGILMFILANVFGVIFVYVIKKCIKRTDICSETV
ncbi:MAG: lipopolysaccharide biosynthesis protein [Lachnospiraceae bacterium]|nr:lipopolysaccharide biosynthesis protein [Lachnospiraceae bacterium]